MSEYLAGPQEERRSVRAGTRTAEQAERYDDAAAVRVDS